MWFHIYWDYYRLRGEHVVVVSNARRADVELTDYSNCLVTVSIYFLCVLESTTRSIVGGHEDSFSVGGQVKHSKKLPCLSRNQSIYILVAKLFLNSFK